MNGINNKILVCVIFLAIICGCSFLEYIYGYKVFCIMGFDNVKVDEYYQSQNSYRLEKIYHSGYDYLENERVAVNSNCRIGELIDGTNWLKKEYGIYTFGTHISTHELCKEGRRVVDYYWNNSWHQREPIYKIYNVEYAFSVFDISGLMKVKLGDQSAQHSLILDDIRLKIKYEYDALTDYQYFDHKKVLCYKSKGDVPIYNCIFCYNQRLYILQVKSDDISYSQSLARDYISNLSVIPIFEMNREYIVFVQFALCAFCLLCVIFILLNMQKGVIQNRQARILYKINLYLLIAEVCLLVCCINYDKEMLKPEYGQLSCALTYSILLSSLAVSWLFRKSKNVYITDYLVPSWYKKCVFYKIETEKTRRLYLTLVVYPFVLLVSTPMAIALLLYVVIVSFIVILKDLIKKWDLWINERE